MNTRFKWVGLAAVLVLSLVGATVVMAAAPLAVHIEVVENTGDQPPEAFVASGPAVDSGLVCANGYVDEVGPTISSGSPGGAFAILRVVKRFDCGGGDTFDVRMVVWLDLTTHYTTAHWTVIGGTGAYAKLHGNGTLAGTPIVPGSSITDVYEGMLH